MRLLFFILLLLFSTLSQARKRAEEPIRVANLSVLVHASLFGTSTRLDLELFNPNEKVMDGELLFSLSDGQVITGFALDINGNLREGVIVDKQKGRVAYENIIRRRVDPGLLEMTEGNNFRLRVYPMPAGGSRRVRISLHEAGTVTGDRISYSLPMQFSLPVRGVQVQIHAAGLPGAPASGTGLLQGETFLKEGNAYTLSVVKKELLPKLPLLFSVPLPAQRLLSCVEKRGRHAFFAIRARTEAAAGMAHKGGRLVIFWDVSLSSFKRDNVKERNFLEAYLKEFRPATVTVLPFSNRVHTGKSWNGSPVNEILSYTGKLVRDGGTQMGALDFSKYGANAFLLFTDGVHTYGNSTVKGADVPVHTVHASASVHSVRLKKMAAASGGHYLDLTKESMPAALQRLKEESSPLPSVEGSAELSDIAASKSGDRSVLITGRMEGSRGELLLTWGRSGVRETVSLLAFGQDSCAGSFPEKTGIVQQLTCLRESPEEDEKEVMEAGKTSGLVTPFTSFIVLDNVMDYIQFDITPPGELLEEYKRMMPVKRRMDEERKAAKETEEWNSLQKTITAYNEKILWWNREASIIQLKAPEQKSLPQDRGGSGGTEGRERDGNAPGNGPAAAFKGSASLQEVVVVGYGTARRRDLTGATVTISGQGLNTYATVGEALQGRAAGVVVVQSGQPGSAPEIRIRGAASVSGSGEPLYVLDGMVVDAETANSILPSSLDRIEVLKDASAGAIWGSRAVNGVIVLTSRRSSDRRDPTGIPKYRELEDVDYIVALQETPLPEKYGVYLSLRDTMNEEPSFYFDVAEHFYRSGMKEEGLRVLSGLADLDPENHQLLRAIGYMLESWGLCGEAVPVYRKVLDVKEEEPQSYRDLALALYGAGLFQESLDLLYRCLSKDWGLYEARYQGLREIMLHELNGIITAGGTGLDLSAIDPALIRPLEEGLRVVIDWNKDETDIDLHILEPGGEESSFNNRVTKSGGRLSKDFTSGYGPEVYGIKEARKGTYRVRVNYYGDRYQRKSVPAFIKVTTFRNFGKPGGEMKVSCMILDGQRGKIELEAVRVNGRE